MGLGLPADTDWQDTHTVIQEIRGMFVDNTVYHLLVLVTDMPPLLTSKDILL